MNAVTPPSIPTCTRPSARISQDGITWDSMGIYGCQWDYTSTKWAKTGVLTGFHARSRLEFSRKSGKSKKKRGNWGQTVCKPGSVRNQRMRGDHSSGMPVTGHLKQPTQAAARKPAMCCLYLVLLRRVYPATAVTGSAVRSYRTLSPLPFRAVCFLWHFPESPPPDVIRRRASVEPGLSSPLARARSPDCLTPKADYGETGPRSSAAWARHTA